MQVLELVHGLEFDDIKTIGDDAIGLALQEMLGLVGGDMRDGGEDVGGMCGRSFNAISVVNAALPSLMIDVEVLEIIVKVDGAGAEVAAEEGGMGGEDGGDVDVALAAEGNGDAGLPFVEVADDCLAGPDAFGSIDVCMCDGHRRSRSPESSLLTCCTFLVLYSPRNQATR